MTGALPWVLAAAAVLPAVVLLRRPLALAGSLLARWALGLAALAPLSYGLGLLGIPLGLNLGNAAVLGVLGAPGLALLLFLNWTFAR